MKIKFSNKACSQNEFLVNEAVRGAQQAQLYTAASKINEFSSAIKSAAQMSFNNISDAGSKFSQQGR